MRLSKNVLLGMLALGLAAASFTMTTQAKAVKKISMKNNLNMAPLTPALQKAISGTTPFEGAGSDLTVVRPATRLGLARLPQGYTSDGTYYYFLNNLASYGSWSNSLRLTRIRYRADGTYSSDYMTLKNFGHGTTLDCVRKGGVTYLWTGSDYSSSKKGPTTISCFTFQSGKTLKKHSSVRYKIRISGENSYGKNVYPAISPDGKTLCVRISRGDEVQFQYYRLYKGWKIKTSQVLKTFRIDNDFGTFQGFDIRGENLYTVEGSPSRAECRELGKPYYPIKIRIYNTRTKKKTTRTIKGASRLSHREPEGIQVDSKGRIHLLIASHYKDLYTCANIYRKK